MLKMCTTTSGQLSVEIYFNLSDNIKQSTHTAAWFKISAYGTCQGRVIFHQKIKIIAQEGC